MSRAVKTALIVGLVIVTPGLLVLDVWLSVQFGTWINKLTPNDGGASAFLGVLAFGVLVACQGVAAWLALRDRVE